MTGASFCTLELFREAIEERALQDSDRLEFYRDLQVARATIQDRPMFVASFSETGDSLSQWRSYCPSRGYAIGFSFEALRARAQKSLLPPSFELARCVYDDAEKRKGVDRVLGAALNNVDTDRQFHEHYTSGERSHIEPALDRGTSGKRALLRDGAALAAICKHSAFRDEREWRLVSLPTWDSPQRRIEASHLP